MMTHSLGPQVCTFPMAVPHWPSLCNNNSSHEGPTPSLTTVFSRLNHRHNWQLHDKDNSEVFTPPTSEGPASRLGLVDWESLSVPDRLRTHWRHISFPSSSSSSRSSSFFSSSSPSSFSSPPPSLSPPPPPPPSILGTLPNRSLTPACRPEMSYATPWRISAGPSAHCTTDWSIRVTEGGLKYKGGLLYNSHLVPLSQSRDPGIKERRLFKSVAPCSREKSLLATYLLC